MFNVLCDFFQHVCHGFSGVFSVKVRLQVDPALRVRAEVRAQAQGCIYGDAAQAFDDFVDAARWHINGFGQGVLADAHGLEPVFQQDDAGVGEGDFTGHGYSPVSNANLMIVNNFNFLGDIARWILKL